MQPFFQPKILMMIDKLLWNPLTGTTVLMALAGFWTYSFTSASDAAQHSAQTVRPWIDMARTQMNDISACEIKAREKAQNEFPAPTDTLERELNARHAAFDCAASYLLHEKNTAAAVVAQVLGYEATAAMRAQYLGLPLNLSPQFMPLYVKASHDAKMASQTAMAADASLLEFCSGWMRSSACSLGHFSPDTTERRLGDSMRSFELDLHAQYWIALHPAQELEWQVKSPDQTDPQASPAYAYAREVVFSK